jgi:MYXO-CTERM domain-containing protein
MRSLILGSSALLLLVAAPASAAQPVTTGETDSGFPEFSVVIVAPEDGAIFDGTPDAVVPVTLEYENFAALSVSLSVDGEHVDTCPDGTPGNPPPPCTFELTLAPGVHELTAHGDDAVTNFDSHTISIEVKDVGAETEGPATDSETGESATETAGDSEGDSAGDTTSPTTGPIDPTSTTTGGDTDGNTDGGDTDGGGSSGDKEGCGCKAAPGLPDLLGLALMALFAPWRRRRHA